MSAKQSGGTAFLFYLNQFFISIKLNSIKKNSYYIIFYKKNHDTPIFFGVNCKIYIFLQDKTLKTVNSCQK